jgi:hypothetical protein
MKCQECCQSWKSLDDDDDVDDEADADDDDGSTANKNKKRRRRWNRHYDNVILVHSNIKGYYPSVDEMLREDKDRVIKVVVSMSKL